MPKQLLNVTVKCKGNDQCLFIGDDMVIEITITNTHKSAIGYPLDFLKKTGPGIKLVNTHNKQETYIPTGLAKFDLKEKFTMIQPGKSLVIEWLIDSYDLKQFGGLYVDLSAEIILGDTILLDGKHVDFLGSDTIHIVSKDKP